MAKISVAMAAYNGMGFIAEQIESILQQLNPEDELVISVDPSTDGTEEFLWDWGNKDQRIHIYTGPGQGLIANFENAIAKTTGDIIFLSDQDDIWLPGKVQRVSAAMKDPNVLVVLHDARIIDKDKNVTGSSFFCQRGSKPGFFHNIVKNSYIGCCMSFKAGLKTAALPFPGNIPMHDQWLGLLAERLATVRFIPDILVSYRRHENNVSSDHHSSLAQMLKWRLIMVKEVGKRVKECR